MRSPQRSSIDVWLQQGPESAPAGLLDGTMRTVRRTPQQRRGWVSTWRPRLPLAAALVGVVAIGLSVIPVLRRPPVVGDPVATPRPIPSAQPRSVGPATTPRPTVTTTPFPSLRATPAPTTPSVMPAVPGAWPVAEGVTLHTPDGWVGPPGGTTLAIIAAVDQLHDPDAGVLHLLMGPTAAHQARSGEYRFRETSPGGPLDAGIRVVRETSAAAERARALIDALRAGGHRVDRRALHLARGTVSQLDYDEDMGFSTLHHRTVFVDIPGGSLMIDLGTMGKPGRALAAVFVAILDSMRVEPSPAPS